MEYTIVNIISLFYIFWEMYWAEERRFTDRNIQFTEENK
jgi:hypothetical protein